MYHSPLQFRLERPVSTDKPCCPEAVRFALAMVCCDCAVQAKVIVNATDSRPVGQLALRAEVRVMIRVRLSSSSSCRETTRTSFGN